MLKKFVRENPHADNAGDFIRHLVNRRHQLQAFEWKDDWYDIGSFAEYSRVDELLKAGQS